MPSTSVLAATATDLRDHRDWRPDWTPDRACLYWYLTFPEDDLVRAVGRAALQEVRDTRWLEAVPPRWCHVTVADVGFPDELDTEDVERVTAAVAETLAGEERLRLTLGPARTDESAVVLAAGPVDRLRAVKARVRRATSSVLGPRHPDVHRHLFWPHVSLGYVNRAVDADTASGLVDALSPVTAEVDVGAVTLAAVTRYDRHYQWQVEATVDLLVRPDS